MYTGIPFKKKESSFKSCDCYGLVRLYYKEEIGLALDPMADFTDRTKLNLRNIVDRHREFRSVEAPYKKGDVALFSSDDGGIHCGVMVSSEYILHTDSRIQSSYIEKLSLMDSKCKLVRMFRHESLL